MLSLLRRITRPTGAVSGRDLRTYQLFSLGCVVAVAIHSFLVLFFLLLGVHFLALGNILSVAIYLLAFHLNRRGMLVATVLLAVVELLCHQVACVLLIGWQAGFQYYLVVASTMVFFLPSGRARTKLAVLLVCTGTYLLLLFGHSQPVHELDRVVLSALSATNVAMLFFIMSTFAWSYVVAAEEAESLAQEQHRKVEALLHNILPASIARRLEDKPGIIADRFEQTTILFADIVGFTPYAERVDPVELVKVLDEVFSCLDDLAERWGLEKIKTIGDAYMLVAGVPDPRPDHAEAMAGFALEAMDVVKERFGATRPVITFRMGMHTGPVVAGVIGKKRLLYDLWGDAVNMAARMESHGIPGCIQVSEATRRALGDGFDLEPRGAIAVKGKGSLRTWLLRGQVGPSPASSQDHPAGHPGTVSMGGQDVGPVENQPRRLAAEVPTG